MTSYGLADSSSCGVVPNPPRRRCIFACAAWPLRFERRPVQGRGAFTPGSLPRDHHHHSLCGPAWRICLRHWEYAELARQYNEPDEVKARVVLSQFLEVLEKGVTPNESIGDFRWVERNFQTWLKSVGRTPPEIKSQSVTDEIDAWAKS